MNDTDAFKSFAASGHNPRRFVSFDERKLEAIKELDVRMSVSGKFSIALAEDGCFDSGAKENVDKLVKYLCGRAMLDPLNLNPREVPASIAWR